MRPTSAYWNRAAGESLHIPTFAAGASGPYLPGTAIKGALRTGMVFANWRDGMLQDVLARVQGERMPRRPAESVEEQALGAGGTNKMRFVSAGDSATVATRRFQNLSAAHLDAAASRREFRAGLEAESARRGGWRASRGQHADVRRDGCRRARSSAAIGTRRRSSCNPMCARACAGPNPSDRAKIFEAANIYAAGVLALQRQYASQAGMGLLDRSLDELEQRLATAKENGTCLLSMGWGGGLLAKSAWLDTSNTDYRQILQQFVIYNRALSTNLPFPKTRRIVFLGNRPATLPGWVELAVEE